METQVDTVEDKNGNCIQHQRQLAAAHRELKRKEEAMKQLSLQWEILLRTIRDLRVKRTELDTLLTRERTLHAKQVVYLESAIEHEKQTLAKIYDSAGWRILDRYQRARQSSQLLSLFHKVLTATIKKLIANGKKPPPVSVNHGDGRGLGDFGGATESLPQEEPVGEPEPLEFAEVLERAGTSDFGGATESLPQEEPVGEPEPLEFAEVHEPTVSIVIPVYNHAGFTYRCLRSLCNSASANTFEVIVVDDCSTDETQELLRRMKGIRVVRNEKNSGFVLSCNIGAAAACGRYVWFLNNDTVVTPGSLDVLVATFLEFPDAGLVGSKLIYPDGKLQEAGGIIWKDASGCNYGRADDPDKPEYCYLRDVDWCSGASIMIPRPLFHELGGFDRRYVPAYYEDVDLAFAVRKAGKRVLLQPLSRIVHAEGASSGTDVRRGVKSFQQINKDKFYHKWKDRLAWHGSPSINPCLKRDRYAKRRILVIDQYTPTPDQDAGSSVAFSYMKIFGSLSYKTTFIPCNDFLYRDPYTPNLQRLGVECLYAPKVVDVESYLRERESEYDVVLLFRLQVATKYIDVVRECCPRAVVVFNPMDLHCLNEERQMILESSAELVQHAKRAKAIALETVGKVDGTIVVSDAECEILSSESPGANVTTIPILFSVQSNCKSFDERRDVCFLGDYQHQPNVDAVSYFVRFIWPLVKQKLPEAKFYALGSDATPEILALATDDVVVVDRGEVLSHYLNRCRISVVPLRYGPDLKGKIGTSMSYGMPCVATSVAVEGLGLKQQENILVGDAPESFAQAVVALYTDKRLWDHISTSGLSLVEAQWSIKVGESKLTEFLAQLTGTPFGPNAC